VSLLNCLCPCMLTGAVPPDTSRICLPAKQNCSRYSSHLGGTVVAKCAACINSDTSGRCGSPCLTCMASRIDPSIAPSSAVGEQLYGECLSCSGATSYELPRAERCASSCLQRASNVDQMQACSFCVQDIASVSLPTTFGCTRCMLAKEGRYIVQCT
jgi:hypothetical protein